MKWCIAVLVLLAIVGCARAPAEREAKPAFKGMELYSWRPTGQDWHFSLLLGTNRNKSIEEVMDPEVTIVGVAALKERLAYLTVGEWVTWGYLGLELFPQELVEDLQGYCRGLEIELSAPRRF